MFIVLLFPKAQNTRICSLHGANNTQGNRSDTVATTVNCKLAITLIELDIHDLIYQSIILLATKNNTN